MDTSRSSGHLLIGSLSHAHHEKEQPGQAQALDEVNKAQEADSFIRAHSAAHRQQLRGRQRRQFVQVQVASDAEKEGKQSQDPRHHVPQHLVSLPLLKLIDLQGMQQHSRQENRNQCPGATKSASERLSCSITKHCASALV